MKITAINLYTNSNQTQRNQIPYNSYKANFMGEDTYDSKLKVKGPSLFNGFDGSIKGDFHGAKVNFEIDQKLVTLLDKKKLGGTYEIDNQEKKCELRFNQKFTWGHTYQIAGNFGDKNVDIRFANPILKYSDVKGKYNSKDVNLKINRKMSNIIRNEYTMTGEINNKKVDLHCKGLFFFGGSMEGTFDGKPVKFSTNQKLNPFVDTRDVKINFDLNNDDKEDLLFLSSAMTINDLYLRK